MPYRFIISAFFSIIMFSACTKTYDCEDLQIRPAFINYLPSDIDTFVLRKYKAGDNYQTLIDTLPVMQGLQTYYQVSNDTISVLVTDGKNGIRAGYDYKLFIPVKNRTVLISDIISEKKRGKRGYGIFSMDPGPGCANNVFSLKVDGQLIIFSTLLYGGPSIFIRN